MIPVTAATWDLLRRRRIGLRRRLMWGMWGEPSVDVTSRLISFSPVEYTMEPALQGANAQSVNIILRNDDGYLTPGAAGGLLADGRRRYLFSRIALQAGIVDDAGNVTEWLPMFYGHVSYLRQRPGRLELRLDHPVTTLASSTTKEDYSVAALDDDGIMRSVSTAISGLLSVSATPFAAKVSVAPEVDSFVTDSAWPLSGTFGAGTPIANAVLEIARAALSVTVPGEDGTIYVKSELIPRAWGYSGGYLPDVVGPETARGVEVVEAVANSASEVQLSFGDANCIEVRRATADETYVRWSKAVPIPLLVTGWQASYAAWLIQGKLSYPRTLLFSSMLGLPLQLNDRVRVQPFDGAAIIQARVVGKAWDGGVPQIAAVEEATETSHFEGAFAEYGTANWNSGIVA